MRDRLLEKMHKKYGCDYCNRWESLYRNNSFEGDILEVYIDLNKSITVSPMSYNPNNYVNIPVKYCPMCGKKLEI